MSPRDLRTIIRESTDPAEQQAAFDKLVARAEAGNPTAALYVGDLYRGGTFVAVDLAKAADAYRIAIDAGDRTAARTLADMHLRGDAPDISLEQALSFYELAADAGDGRALQKLGDIYRDGTLVTASTDMAIDYYNRAIEAGLASASLRLGDLYRNGLDPAASFPVYEAAGDEGDTAAMLRLGDAYRDGVAGQFDRSLAATWYQDALDAGDEKAFNRLVSLYLGDPATVEQGVAMLESAIAAGQPGAALTLANAYLNGQGVESNVPRAISILEAATQAGDPAATRRLIRLYVDGKGKALARQPQVARQILEQAATVLDEDALFRDRLSIDAAEAQNPSAFSSILDRFRALDGAAKSSLAGQMGMANPNAYVLFLQAHLQDQGLYTGQLSGLLTQSTINAFNVFCAEHDASAACQGGPLSSPARRVFRDVLESNG